MPTLLFYVEINKQTKKQQKEVMRVTGNFTNSKIQKEIHMPNMTQNRLALK